MISGKTKTAFLKELEKSGNIGLSCVKVGIDRSTHYRWLASDKEYQKRANRALRHGVGNNCDIAKHVLMMKIKEKDMGAVKYLLSHLDPAFKPKRSSNVVITHKKNGPIAAAPEVTIEDLLGKMHTDAHAYGLELQEEFTKFGGKIPKKPDGTSMEIEEIPNYKAYIENWQRAQAQERDARKMREYRAGLNGTTYTEDSASDLDTPSEAPKND